MKDKIICISVLVAAAFFAGYKGTTDRIAREAKANAEAEKAARDAYEAGYKAGLDAGAQSAYFVGRADGYAMAPVTYPDGNEDLLMEDDDYDE